MTQATTPSLELDRGLEKLIVNASEFNGKPHVSLRLHYEREDGTWAPTKKGVTLRSADEIDQVVAVHQELRSTLPGPSVE